MNAMHWAGLAAMVCGMLAGGLAAHALSYTEERAFYGVFALILLTSGLVIVGLGWAKVIQ